MYKMCFSQILSKYTSVPLLRYSLEHCFDYNTARSWLPNGHYAPNFKEVDGAYWFRVVRGSVRPFVKKRAY